MFYGAEQAGIHDRAFGKLAAFAGDDLLALLATAGHRRGTVADLGCGSGILARRLTDAGYDVVGVDISADMVALARKHAPTANFTVASLHDAVLPEGCVGVAATGEALNYAADPRAGLDALERLAGQIHAALAPGGSWLFDVSGPGRAGPTRTTKQFHRHEDWCLGMTATEADDGQTLDRQITIFSATPGGGYARIEEHHVLRLYDADQVAAILHRAGFDVEVLTDFRAAAVPLNLPGWYVVVAHKGSLRPQADQF
jgi:SAM-dependent methyltransferase